MSILVLFRKDMDLKPNFMQILTTLITFDIFCIIFNWSIFGLPLMWETYFDHVFPYIVPYILPLAQIALTGKPFLHILFDPLDFGTVLENHQYFSFPIFAH